jgi:hypothetical protein
MPPVLHTQAIADQEDQSTARGSDVLLFSSGGLRFATLSSLRPIFEVCTSSHSSPSIHPYPSIRLRKETCMFVQGASIAHLHVQCMVHTTSPPLPLKTPHGALHVLYLVAPSNPELPRSFTRPSSSLLVPRPLQHRFHPVDACRHR